MEYLFIAVILAAVFLLCWLVDKGFTKLFRSQAQHMSGLSLRPNKKFGAIGLIVAVIGIAGVMAGATDSNKLMVFGSAILIFTGVGLAVYYLSTGIFYDDDSFLCTAFGRKGRTYFYRDILHQQLYAVQGGSLIIELYMADGKTVQVLSTMPDYHKFLDHAHTHWCRQKGLASDANYDPDHSIWFPTKEAP